MTAVLVVVTRVPEAEPLMRWGWCFARAVGGDLDVIYPVRAASESVLEAIDLGDEGDGQAPIEDRVVERMRAVAAELASQPTTGDGPGVSMVRAQGREPQALVLERVDEVGPDFLLVGRDARGAAGSEEGGLGPRLLELAPCDTILLRAPEGSGGRCQQILLPASGGPHARLALRLVNDVALAEGAELSALYVEPELGEEAKSVGLRKLERTLRDANLDPNVKVRARVVVSDDVSAGIREVASEGYDLVLVGASNRGFVRRTLYSTVPARLLRGEEATTVGVVRRARPTVDRWREAAGRLLRRYIPQLERDDRVALFERLEEGSRFTFDFSALICLSTAIAALGLIQDAGAVVIGAMLVAPLLTPMIGAGLGLVQGNLVLVRRSARSIGWGFLLALLIGFVVGLVTPIPGLTNELAARGAPNLLDLGIAFISGVAAAYAVARPNLSAALPGVAIAAALVPPIATAGVGLAMGEGSTARGAAMLFGTNLVAIILGSALTLYLVGVRGNRERGRGRLWARRVVMGLTIVALVLSFPLTSVMVSRLAEQSGQGSPVADELREAIAQRLDEEADMALVDVQRLLGYEEPRLRVVVRAPEPVSGALVGELARVVAAELGRPVDLLVATELSVQAVASVADEP